jgi:hypothetical protein
MACYLTYGKQKVIFILLIEIFCKVFIYFRNGMIVNCCKSPPPIPKLRRQKDMEEPKDTFLYLSFPNSPKVTDVIYIAVD